MYIKREALIAELAKGTIITDDLYGMGIMAGVDFAIKTIRKQPAADVVEVVRCKDCRFYETDVEYYGGGTKDVCRLLKRQTQCDDFCSYGERK